MSIRVASLSSLARLPRYRRPVTGADIDARRHSADDASRSAQTGTTFHVQLETHPGRSVA
jgi:hypothetical protein